ncbi:Zn-dependent hydrolase [Bacillus sp. REN16]|uniref:Zn-dependent hydrolase n=1 Tax=Bacillus sp. REN16 TaxID=2887296 RepID=UPI001E3A0128|nr:Zn-dependent hydrolase [Bacillus sp. REN16]MCC3359160.1 Zn-dependent hydrolase [Bacillus sp. REN16]
MNIINADRLWQDVMELATYTESGQPWTRRSFSKLYNEGRDWLIRKMEAAGLEIEVDAAANIIGRRAGQNPSLPPIVIGSHTDTVQDGGRFDGISGVLVGLEVLRTLNEKGIILEYPIELVDFTAEEPSEYGLSTVGSRAWSGNLTEDMLSYTNKAGETLAEAIRRSGGNPKEIHTIQRKADTIALYLELHIEQGPVLLKKQSSLGVVSGIVGIQRYHVTVEGLPNHAGTTPMNMRNDALNGACEMSLQLERIANETYDAPVVGTVGEFNNFPNGSNVVPGRVTFSVEVRSISSNVIDKVCEHFITQANAISNRRGLKVTIESISRSTPIVVQDQIKLMLRESCEKVTNPVIELPSGAGHDANQISLIGPVGMLFIPCRDGRSHCPEEWAEKEDLALGATAILNMVQSFSKTILEGGLIK